MMKSTFWTERRFTGLILILGCLLYIAAVGGSQREEGSTVAPTPSAQL
jgi:hypothetical protein